MIATTGTGGDLFPGIAVAERVLAGGGHTVSFVISGEGVAEEALTSRRFPYETLKVGRLKGEGIVGRLETLSTLPSAFGRAFKLIRRSKPQVLLGTGGHSAGPVLMASAVLKVPRAILEPNLIPGLTNRLLTPWVHRIYAGFEETAGSFPAKKVLVTGVPVRRSFLKPHPRQDDRFTVLVFGGSQGAATINKAMIRGVPVLLRSGRPFRLVHITGRRSHDVVVGEYKDNGISGNTLEVLPFSSQMERLYAEADLVVSRSGGSTLAELLAVKKPALLVPYPHAAADHQTQNAGWFVGRGFGEVLTDSDLAAPGGGNLLAEKILEYEADRPKLRRLGDALQDFYQKDPAEVISRDLVRLGERRAVS